MVLYQAAINRWVKPVIENHRDEGRAEANRQWEEWLQRETEADSKGLAFDEPPPAQRSNRGGPLQQIRG